MRKGLIPFILFSAGIIWRRRVHAAHLARLAPYGKTLTLSDGRVLGYAEYGDPDGKPILFFHGTPGSRLIGKVYHDVAAQLGARIIAPERPGYGFSTPQSNRTLLDWTNDVAELADALEIERFAVFGVSGGGPHAAACAYKIPDRLTAVGLVSSVSPPEAPGWDADLQPLNHLMATVGRTSPWLAGMIGQIFNLPFMLLPPEQIKKGITKQYPEHTHLLHELFEILVDDMREAFRGGVLGMGTDFISAKPWGFNLADIHMDPVFLWHGEADTNAPPAMGHYLAEMIPNCRATFYDGEDHAIASLTHREEVLTSLLSTD